MYPALPHLDGVRHSYLDVGDLRVHVAEAGPPDAPPVVLLHGWPQHWWCWRRVAGLLAEEHRLVMPDLRGLGWTAAPRDGYDKARLAADLVGTMDALELDRVLLVGHDWGGWAGFLACLDRPNRFSAFLALGVVHPFQKLDSRVLTWWRFGYQLLIASPVVGGELIRTQPRLVESMLRAGAGAPDTFTAEDLRIYSSALQDPARAQASVALYRTWLLRESAAAAGTRGTARLRVPTRLMVGADDPVCRPALLRGWEGYADDMAVERLPGVGHFVPEEAPREVAAAVRELVAAHR
jgi:pimeloyl-ACP methyl ester carboxylesterase